MMKGFVFLVLMACNISMSASTDSLVWIKKDFPEYSLTYTANDSSIANIIENNLASGSKQVTAFFREPFQEKFSIYIFPSRSVLNEQWRRDWNMPGFNSECWMVASGVAKRLDILSPKQWKQEACEHNGNDSVEIQQIITHELTHVFDGQICPNHNFDGMDDFAWLIEGLATYVSGQLTDAKIKSVKENLVAGNSPASLADFWKGKTRYQQAGSMIKYIDEKYGRNKLTALLRLTTLEEMMKILNTTEKELIAAWKDFYK